MLSIQVFRDNETIMTCLSSNHVATLDRDVSNDKQKQKQSRLISWLDQEFRINNHSRRRGLAGV